MSWLSKAYEKVKKSFGKKDAESAKEKCPKKETGLLVVVLRKENRRPIEKAAVLIKGKTGSSKRTDKDGIAFFKPLEPDAYEIDVTLPRDMSEDYEKPEAGKQTVGEGSCPIKVVHAGSLAALKVQVHHKGDPAKVLGGATIEVSGVQSHSPQKTQKADGTADFGKTKAGKYTIRATLKEEDKKSFGVIHTPVEVVLQAGKEKVIPIEVAPVNVVTPKIDMEYKVVLLEADLPDPEKAKINTDPTYIVVYVEQTNKNNPFRNNGKLKCSPAKVKAFLDEACTNEIPGEPGSGITLSNAQLTGAQKTKIYLKGKTAGQFEVSLELEDPSNGSIKVEKPVETKGKEKMGVVNLQLLLYQQDADALKNIQVDPDADPPALSAPDTYATKPEKYHANLLKQYHDKLRDKALPDQKEMTNDEKVKKSRLLHVQKDGNFGRAKLVCKKLDAGQWPAGTDNYEIVLGQQKQSGQVEAYDKEYEGTVKSFPVKIALGDLKAGDQTFWIQGKSATKKWGDVRLDLGVDRPEGGLAKKPKRNGDWARFTVVQIQEVKISYKDEAGKASAWDQSQRRFYINLAAQWDTTNKKFTTDGDTDEKGRTIKIGAQLSEKLKDVTIHFMLAPDKNNGKAANWGVDLPPKWKWNKIAVTLKHKDKKDRKDLLHLTEKTNDEGYAEKELVLSRFGGDKFTPGCYTDQDPHLAKYVHGHTDLEKKKPVFAPYAIRIWRKFWYQFTKADGFSPPLPANAVTAYRDVRAQMVLDQQKSFIETATGTAGEIVAPARTFYEDYILNGGNSTTKVANVGDYNKNAIANAAYEAKSDQPVKNQLIVCTCQYDVKKSGNKRKATGRSAAITSDIHGTKVKITMDKPVFDPPLHGGSMVHKLYWYRKSAPGVKHNIAAAKAGIPKPRANNRQIEVDVPVINPAPGAGNNAVYIVATCWSPWGPYLGESFGKHSLIVYKSTSQLYKDDYHDTVVHEIGHALRQVPKPGKQPGHPGVVDHPNQKDEGQGNHCRVNDGVDAGKTKYVCVMYDSGPNRFSKHVYCKTCHPYILVENFSSFDDL